MNIYFIRLYDYLNKEIFNHYAKVLYELLSQREKHESISHKSMPTFEDHVGFIHETPYEKWYLISNESDQIVGTIYLTHKNEIGVQIFKDEKKQGYATMAIKKLIEENPNLEYFANINPKNEASIKLFKKFNFKHIQNTYRLIIS